jgi:hypothetical protein
MKTNGPNDFDDELFTEIDDIEEANRLDNAIRSLEEALSDTSDWDEAQLGEL